MLPHQQHMMAGQTMAYGMPPPPPGPQQQSGYMYPPQQAPGVPNNMQMGNQQLPPPPLPNMQTSNQQPPPPSMQMGNQQLPPPPNMQMGSSQPQPPPPNMQMGNQQPPQPNMQMNNQQLPPPPNMQMGSQPPPQQQQQQQQHHAPQLHQPMPLGSVGMPQAHHPHYPHQAPPMGSMPAGPAYHQHGPPPSLQHHPPQHMHHPGQLPPQHHPGGLPGPPKIKLDQHAMPSAAQLIADEIKIYKKADKPLMFTAPASLPPLVTTLEKLNISLQDGGCVRPCHMRSTIYQVPVSKDILESSGLELGVVVKPFDEGEVDGKFFIPLSTSEIVRCNRCKAYVNPFSRNGQCCICNFTAQGMQELDQRPELHLGSYEFRVTPEYYRDGVAETRRPHIIFAIEMTVHSRHLVHYVAQNLAGVIKSHFPKDFLYSGSNTPLVGFVTYNSKVTLYDVMNGGHAYVISDMNSVTECLSKFLVDPAENFEEIERFLSSLPEKCSDLEQQTVLGPAIEAALKACQVDTSNYFQAVDPKKHTKNVIPTGKVYLLHSSLPTHGDDKTPGRLSAKNIDEMKRHLGTETEGKTLIVEGKYYTQLAQRCINDYGSGVELFLFPPHPRAFSNIATIGELAKLTGSGVINKYHMSCLDNFIEDLKISLKATMGFDASIRVRTSTGISPVRYIGHFNQTVGSNLEMSAVNTNSNIAVQMKYDDKISENDLVVIQFAMIYTSVCGERRVRVHNLALAACQSLADLYKSACCDTLMNVMVRDTVDKIRAGSLAPKVAKEQLTARVISILAAYRKHCTDNHAGSSSQLILPEGLKLLPVYLCGALKCDAIDGGMEMFPDDKVLAQLNLIGALPSVSQVTIYPRMYSIEACDADDEENESGLTAVLTRCYNLALEEETGQCYILENGYYLFIFFPNTEIGQSFLSSVFGSHKDDAELVWESRQKDTVETSFIEDLLAQIKAERKRALRISVVRQGRDKMEHVFKTFLYEDKKRPDGAAVAASKLDNASYVDLLCYLHTEIRSKMAQ